MIPGEVDRFLRSAVKVDPYTSHLLMMEAYDIDFRIADHNLALFQGPMNLIKMYPKEDPVSYSRRYELIRRFGIYRIKEHFGFNIEEFLHQPREYVEFYLRLGAEYAVESKKAADAARESVEQALGGGKK
ncbi:MAG TPA: hypothetical protein VN081_01150 [Dongiaceae bacterium]|nr:hypothetical protein [Dongiaceae bacterium]